MLNFVMDLNFQLNANMLSNKHAVVELKVI